MVNRDTIESLLKESNTLFENEETEQNWHQFNSNLSKWDLFIRSHSSNPTFNLKTVMSSIRSISKPISNSILSERTILSATASELVRVISEVAGTQFDSISDLFLPPLLKLCQRSNKLFVKRSEAIIISIIQNSKLPRIAPTLCEVMLTNKNKTARTVAARLINVLLQINTKQSLDSYADSITACVAEGLQDSSKEVRDECREVYISLKRHWENLALCLVSSLDPRLQKLIEPSSDDFDFKGNEKDKNLKGSKNWAIRKPLSQIDENSNTQVNGKEGKEGKETKEVISMSKPVQFPMTPLRKVFISTIKSNQKPSLSLISHHSLDDESMIIDQSDNLDTSRPIRKAKRALLNLDTSSFSSTTTTAITSNSSNSPPSTTSSNAPTLLFSQPLRLEVQEQQPRMMSNLKAQRLNTNISPENMKFLTTSKPLRTIISNPVESISEDSRPRMLEERPKRTASQMTSQSEIVKVTSKIPVHQERKRIRIEQTNQPSSSISSTIQNSNPKNTFKFEDLLTASKGSDVSKRVEVIESLLTSMETDSFMLTDSKTNKTLEFVLECCKDKNSKLVELSLETISQFVKVMPSACDKSSFFQTILITLFRLQSDGHMRLKKSLMTLTEQVFNMLKDIYMGETFLLSVLSVFTECVRIYPKSQPLLLSVLSDGIKRQQAIIDSHNQSTDADMSEKVRMVKPINEDEEEVVSREPSHEEELMTSFKRVKEVKDNKTMKDFDSPVSFHKSSSQLNLTDEEMPKNLLEEFNVQEQLQKTQKLPDTFISDPSNPTSQINKDFDKEEEQDNFQLNEQIQKIKKMVSEGASLSASDIPTVKHLISHQNNTPFDLDLIKCILQSVVNGRVETRKEAVDAIEELYQNGNNNLSTRLANTLAQFKPTEKLMITRILSKRGVILA